MESVVAGGHAADLVPDRKGTDRNDTGAQGAEGRGSGQNGAVTGHGWLTLLAVGLGSMVVQLDSSIVSIANPAIALDLGAGLSQIGWVTTAYMLVLAGLLIPAGAIADRIGHKKSFLLGVGGFSIASVLCGMADSVEFLIGARILQGVFAALLSPAGLAVLRAAFPPDKLGMAFGIFGSVSAISIAGGPIIGGVLVQYASWPWAFYINLPVGIVAVLVGALVIRESERAPVTGRLDVLGAVTLTVTMVLLIVSISGVATYGWFAMPTLGLFLVGLALLAVFVLIERRASDPMVPLELFRNRTFSVGVVLMTVITLAFFAVLFYLTFYLQGVRGYTPIEAAVAMLPMTLVFAVSAPLAGLLATRIGLRGTLVTGSVLTVVALGMLVRLDAGSGFWTLAPALVIVGFGIGFVFVPAIEAIVGSAPVEQAGAASGIQGSTSQLGSTFGVAIFGSVIATVVSSRFGGALTDAFAGKVLPPGVTVDQIAGQSQVRQSVGLGFSPAMRDAVVETLTRSGLSDEQAGRMAATVAEAAHRTFLDGMHTVFLYAAGVAVVAGLISLLVGNGKKS
ncbi:DHA2 family efflux MFS transporter permease subunit [Pseudonocardiaceae bacterium YIM PH 21723]|nr:DHA2 family efflux MFS transporter permease subunit [Pseudonocardiaceae bacterium YIM PH 21723]